MHGLPQSGNIANDLLTSRLDKFGYYPWQYTPGLWRHKWSHITFSLVVDDFGVKCEGIQHDQHLKESLETYHELSVDWKENLFFRVSLDCDYKGKMVDLSMPGYISKSLTKYQHSIPPCPQHQPYKYTPFQYSAKFQQAVEPGTSAPLTKDQIKHVQDIVGKLLYYGRAVDPTIVTAIIEIVSCQSKVTEAVLKVFHQLLDYIATHPYSAIWYHVSDMIIALDTDAPCLFEHGDKLRASAYMFLAKKTNQISKMVPY